MNPDGFLADVLEEPATLSRVLDHADVTELALAIDGARAVVLLGMGSSRFAALTAAARLNARGVPAVVEYASTDVALAPAPDVVAIGISATGGSQETVAALARHHGRSRTFGRGSGGHHPRIHLRHPPPGRSAPWAPGSRCSRTPAAPARSSPIETGRCPAPPGRTATRPRAARPS